MSHRFHGVMSLGLIVVSLAVGFFVVASSSPSVALIYLVLSLSGGVAIVYAYCAKCPCRNDSCGHVLPGLLTRMLPRRDAGPYQWGDYLATTVALLVLFGFPQPWLLANPVAFWIFWGIGAAGLVEILLFVCRRCQNRECPVCRLRNPLS